MKLPGENREKFWAWKTPPCSSEEKVANPGPSVCVLGSLRSLEMSRCADPSNQQSISKHRERTQARKHWMKESYSNRKKERPQMVRDNMVKVTWKPPQGQEIEERTPPAERKNIAQATQRSMTELTPLGVDRCPPGLSVLPSPKRGWQAPWGDLIF